MYLLPRVNLELRSRLLELKPGIRSVSLQNPRLRGDQISFNFTAEVNGDPARYELDGRIEGDAIAGSAALSGKRIRGRLDWNAKRIAGGWNQVQNRKALAMIFGTAARKTSHIAAKFCGVFLVTGFVSAPAFTQDYGDTPYVPTPQNVVDKMLEVAQVGPKDYVIDLGSGDGRMVITAAKKYGARGFGVDLDKRLVAMGNRLAARAGVADRAKFYARDLYETDVSRATVLTIYLLPEVNLMVRPRLLAMLKPGTRIVSHDYDMGEWTPDLSLILDAPDKPVGRDHRSKVFYWIMPATVSGKWRWQLPVEGKPLNFELALHQNFQNIEGTVEVDGRKVAIEDAKLAGTQIGFSVVVNDNGASLRYQFSGRIVNNAIEGQAQIMRDQAGRQLAWNATRTELWEPAHASLKPPQLPQMPN